MKETYTEESWGRFKELMQDSTKRLAITETRSQNNEDNIAELQPIVEELQEFTENVNDITTGINLLRGTKDFRKGTINKYQNNTTYLEDGFAYGNSFTTYKDDEGFTVVSITRSGLTSDLAEVVISSAVPCSIGDEFTFSVDFMSEDVSAIDDGALISILMLKDGVVESPESYMLKTSQVNAVNGKWTTATISFKVTSPESAYIFVRGRAQRNGNFNFRKFNLIKGTINNPIWSASPFDVDRINDITTEANLIRGTRDWSTGTKKFGTGSLFEDGFYTAHIWNQAKDDSGFTILSNGETGTIQIHNSIRGNFTESKQYTLAIQFMTTDKSKMGDGIVFATNYIQSSDSVINGTTKNFNISSTGLKDSIENNKWYNLVFHLTTDPNIQAAGIRVSVVSNNASAVGVINYKKPLVFEGYVEHPEWSANPFDYASSSDFTEPNLLPYIAGLYPGVDLATKFKSEIGSNHIANWLSSRVSQGNFEGINIGDYVDITMSNSVKKRHIVVAIDPFYGASYKTHHLVLMPETCWTLNSKDDGEYFITGGFIKWGDNNNGTSAENSPYMASNLHKWEIEVLLPRYPQEWQNVMLEIRLLLENRYSASNTLTSSVGYAWKQVGKLVSPSETEVCGQVYFGDSKWSTGIDCRFPYFGLTKARSLSTGEYVWLRTPEDGSSANISAVGSSGSANSRPASSSSAFPCPYFLVG